MRTIPLTKGYAALVDDEDYEALARFKWTVVEKPNGRRYAYRQVRFGPRKLGKTRTILMHRVITGALLGEDVDHENSNGLDNQRRNLRRCTRSQNLACRRFTKARSGIRGTTLDRRTGNWCARIVVNGRRFWLGVFSDAASAGKAYDEAARRLYGEFAWQNYAA